MTISSFFKNPAIIGYLVRKIRERDRDKQIGKTFIQKMMYLVAREGVTSLSYSMYHYGPYSPEVSTELMIAEDMEIITMEWIGTRGYFIESASKSDKFEKHLKSEEKQKIDEILDKYSGFNAIELSLITTAFYLRDEFGVEDIKLAEMVHNVKPEHSSDYIGRVLARAGMI